MVPASRGPDSSGVARAVEGPEVLLAGGRCGAETPHTAAKVAAVRSRPGLSPAATKSVPATATPTPRRLTSSGATALTRWFDRGAGAAARPERKKMPRRTGQLLPEGPDRLLEVLQSAASSLVDRSCNHRDQELRRRPHHPRWNCLGPMPRKRCPGPHPDGRIVATSFWAVRDHRRAHTDGFPARRWRVPERQRTRRHRRGESHGGERASFTTVAAGATRT